jgi:large-conductance mechanosensitive channel
MNVTTATFRSEFQEFMFTNGIIVSAAGWAVGVATKEFIQSFLEKSLIPIFLGIGNMFMIVGARNWIQKNSKVLTYFSEIVWVFLLWFLTILFTFIILEYIFNRHIVGLKTKVKDSDQHEFDQSKIEKFYDQVVNTKLYTNSKNNTITNNNPYTNSKNNTISNTKNTNTKNTNTKNTNTKLFELVLQEESTPLKTTKKSWRDF